MGGGEGGRGGEGGEERRNEGGTVERWEEMEGEGRDNRGESMSTAARQG